jgi:hypothetical protein
MTDITSVENTHAVAETSNAREVRMSQDAFDAVVGERVRKAREISQEEKDKIRAEAIEQARKEAAEIARQEVSAVLSQREQKTVTDEQAKQLSELTSSLERKFESTMNENPEWGEEVHKYDWSQKENLMLMPALDQVENSGEVLLHLSKNNLIGEIRSYSPAAIIKKVKEISEALKVKAPVTERTPTISRLRPSHVKATNPDGPKTIKDFRGAKFLKG